MEQTRRRIGAGSVRVSARGIDSVIIATDASSGGLLFRDLLLDFFVDFGGEVDQSPDFSGQG